MVGSSGGGDIESHGASAHSHSHSHGHAHSHPTTPSTTATADNSVLCLAVVRESNADVVLFDAKGVPRSFSFHGAVNNNSTNNINNNRVCFSSHGHDADDLLTPCFDEDGHHGIPEETCFCGVETPHLHAHLHDPKICDAEDDACGNIKIKSEEALMKLAKLTLHPTDMHNDNNEKAPLLQIPVTENMPNECNAHEFFNSLSHGENAGVESFRHKRRIHKVQHGDHEDYLVYDNATGLYLQHPHYGCNGCGQDDVHGRFNLIGKRTLMGGANGNDLRLEFFEAAPRKFTILEFITHHFAPDPGLMAAIRPVVEKKTPAQPSCCSKGTCSKTAAAASSKDNNHPGKTSTATTTNPTPSCCASGVCTNAKTDNCCSGGTCTAVSSFMPPELLDPLPAGGNGKTVRSTIVCSQICCSSEIPGINKVMETLEGVSKTMINVPLKQVNVDHDPSVITAKDIESALNRAKFGATIKRDGGAGMAAMAGGKGRSHFFVEKICCASEIPAINSILEPMEGVSKVSINVTTKLVYVDHDTGIVSAQALCDALNKAAFGASIRKDAGQTSAGGVPAYVTSKLKFENGEPDTENLKRLLRTFKPSQMESFVVDVPSKVITVVHNPLLLPLEDILVQLEEQTGLKATIVTNGADGLTWNFPTMEQSSGQQPDSGEDHKWPKPTVILSGVFWVISMLSIIGGNWEYLKYVALLSVVFGIPGIAIKALATLRRCMFDTNCLMLFAAIGAVALQEYAEAAAVTFLFAISEWLEVRATTRARNALNAIVKLRPDYAFIVHPATKEQMMVPAASVPVGAVVAVKTGDKIPCDGVVIEGNSAVDESSLTGESRPVKKGPKDLVSGGTINCGSTHLMIQTTATADDSAISRLVALVEEAQANRSETEKIVDEFAKVYTPIVVLAALCMCTIPWAFGKETGRLWTNNGLVLIVVACPCALIISTPVTYVAGLAATAQRGVLIKGGAHLEALGLTKTICFDKTGTLTQGSFALVSIDTFSTEYARKEVLEYLLLMEERANHPLALAIIDGSRNEGFVSPKNKTVQDHTFHAGEGLSGKIDGLQIYVGNERLFRRLGLFEGLPEDIENMIGNWEAMAGTVGFMSIEGAGIVCAYCVADAIRPESMEVVEALCKLGIDVHMLTGDNKDAARAIGNLVGLKPESINSQLLPEEKLNFITSMKSSRSGRSVLSNPFSRRELVCHVGDGVNDAPALAAADIGVAMGVGAALAMETADVTLLDSNLKKLLYSVTMGRRVLRKIKENVAFSLIVKGLVLGFTIAGKVQLWAAIVSDVGAMLCVTLNGMLLLPSHKINREKMGDIENVTYHSQISADEANVKELEVEKLAMEYGSEDPPVAHTCSHNHSHEHHGDHNHSHEHHGEHNHSHEHQGDYNHSHEHQGGHNHSQELQEDEYQKDCNPSNESQGGHNHSHEHQGHNHSHGHNVEFGSSDGPVAVAATCSHDHSHGHRQGDNSSHGHHQGEHDHLHSHSADHNHSSCNHPDGDEENSEHPEDSEHMLLGTEEEHDDKSHAHAIAHDEDVDDAIHDLTDMLKQADDELAEITGGHSHNHDHHHGHD